MKKHDFHNFSVGQALARLDELLKSAEGPQEIWLENQVVKLNLLKHLTQLGVPHETEKQQHRYRILIQALTPTQVDSTPKKVNFPSEKGFWLLIAQDQIGNRDPELGRSCLQAALSGVRPHEFVGVFLVHRGVRLLSPEFDTKITGTIQKWDLPTFACQRSLAFFGIEHPGWVQAASFESFSQATSLRDWIWI
ncbi:MAG: hypothetical protein H6510_10150 [Acidobacteria bacterium]|nr:hypothetical protein [Acidobacteriota bacterium]MCB9398170.1 hypothetical protein [Acidobacteriota bacterium]